MNRINAVILLLFVSVAASAQGDRLPWVDGNFPPVMGRYRYMVALGEGQTLANARNDAFNGLIENLGNQAGVSVNSQTISEIRTSLNYAAGSQRYDETQDSKTTHRIDREGFRASFIKVSEYYEYERGRYLVWELYEVSDGEPFQAYIPQYSSHYGMSAALRSAVVPGWGQFHKGKTGKGVFFLTSEIAIVSTAVFFQTKRADNIRKSQETTNINIVREYRDRADNWTLYRNVAIGAAAGVYLWNVVDAALAKGKIRYVTDANIRLNATQYDGYYQYGFLINF